MFNRIISLCTYGLLCKTDIELRMRGSNEFRNWILNTIFDSHRIKFQGRNVFVYLTEFTCLEFLTRIDTTGFVVSNLVKYYRTYVFAFLSGWNHMSVFPLLNHRCYLLFHYCSKVTKNNRTNIWFSWDWQCWNTRSYGTRNNKLWPFK